MTRGKVTFLHPDQALEQNMSPGMPNIEAVLEAELGACIGCGASPDKMMGGMLIEAKVVGGVLRGDAVCEACIPKMGLNDDVPDGFFDRKEE